MDLEDLAVDKNDIDGISIVNSKSSINLRSVNILIQISEIVKKQAKLIEKVMENFPHLDSDTFTLENEKFVYNSRISLRIPHGRDNFKKVSPNKDYTDLIDNDDSNAAKNKVLKFYTKKIHLILLDLAGQRCKIQIIQPKDFCRVVLNSL